MTKVIDKETWIKSRTNAPARLGKETWATLYELILGEMRGSQILAIAKNALKPLYMNMAREYLAKLGISCTVDESNWEYIFNFIKNMDPVQNPIAIRMGLQKGLEMLSKKNPKKEPAKSTIMDKETWIKSRTNETDKKALENWGSLYNLVLQERQGSKVLEVAKEALKPLHVQMARKWLARNGLSYNLEDNDPYWKPIYNLMTNVDRDQTSPGAIQALLNYYTTTAKKRGKKTPLDVFKDASKIPPVPKRESYRPRG